MNYSIEVRFHPIYELLNSLLSYSNSSFYKKTELGMNWRKATSSKISKELAEALNSKQLEHLSYLSEYVLCQPISNKSIDQVLEDLHNTDEQQVIQFLSELHVSKDYLDSHKGTFHETLQLVKKWNEEYFCHIDSNIISSLERSCEQKRQEEYDGDSLDFVEKVTNGIVMKGFDKVKKVILYPVFHSTPIITISHYQHLHCYGYPVDLPPLAEEEPSPALMRKGIALTDKNRLKILRFLGKEERSFTEIVKYIGLAKSTVHHHMIILRASGLIQVILSPDTSERFRLREQGLGHIFQNYYQYLFPTDL
ncbi:ArsR/SmtB family transcription factor [Sutcliffiella halmapala]|uniref:ArsR/SmtB family transcription factor n=1 Tax=Sutcliffiella halmapala TaxID=79882 RepID=UPI000995A14A|nr:winged helix-turn-helix domain-containing protein [Sutcliffiella halmapala]